MLLVLWANESYEMTIDNEYENKHYLVYTVPWAMVGIF